MQTFLLPASLLVLSFWIGMLVTYYYLRGSVNRLALRVKRIEKQLGGRNTDDFSQGQYQTRPQPPYAPRSRYVTVDREMKY